jgi:hypothetical protein
MGWWPLEAGIGSRRWRATFFIIMTLLVYAGILIALSTLLAGRGDDDGLPTTGLNADTDDERQKSIHWTLYEMSQFFR